MPSLSPILDDRKYSSNPTDDSPLLSYEEETETTTATPSFFISLTTVALVVVGVALAVTAFYSAPIAIAATCALGLAGLAYGAVQYFGWFQASMTAQTGTEGVTVTDEQDTSQNTETHTSSFTTIMQDLPTIEEEPEVSEEVQDYVQPQQESSDFQASQEQSHEIDPSPTSPGMK